MRVKPDVGVARGRDDSKGRSSDSSHSDYYVTPAGEVEVYENTDSRGDILKQHYRDQRAETPSFFKLFKIKINDYNSLETKQQRLDYIKHYGWKELRARLKSAMGGKGMKLPNKYYRIDTRGVTSPKQLMDKFVKWYIAVGQAKHNVWVKRSLELQKSNEVMLDDLYSILNGGKKTDNMTTTQVETAIRTQVALKDAELRAYQTINGIAGYFKINRVNELKDVLPDVLARSPVKAMRMLVNSVNLSGRVNVSWIRFKMKAIGRGTLSRTRITNQKMKARVRQVIEAMKDKYYPFESLYDIFDEVEAKFLLYHEILPDEYEAVRK